MFRSTMSITALSFGLFAAGARPATPWRTAAASTGTARSSS